MIEIKGIQKVLQDKIILNNINAVFEAGKCNLIIGASGSGKTVLTKCMVGLFKPDNGQVFYDKIEFVSSSKIEKSEIQKQIGMLFQSNALFDSLSVEDNIAFPLNMFSDYTKKEKKKKVDEVLEKVNLKGINALFPNELSGGMKKRVGIARAIIHNPKYLFCDEPNSGLDPQSSILIDQLIKEITDEFNITTIVVTHDMNSVMGIGDKIIFLYKGDIKWVGKNTEIIENNQPELNDFIFASDFLKEVQRLKKNKLT